MTRIRRRLAVVSLAAVLGLAASSAAVTTRSITQGAIGGAGLGMKKHGYVRAFGRPMRADQLEGGLTKLVFKRVDVFLKRDIGVAITTIGQNYRTSAGVGPCSRAKTLLHAYGHRLRKLPPGGKIVLYRLDNLVFRVAGRRVRSVTLVNAQLAVLIAGNSRGCVR